MIILIPFASSIFFNDWSEGAQCPKITKTGVVPVIGVQTTLKRPAGICSGKSPIVLMFLREIKSFTWICKGTFAFIDPLATTKEVGPASFQISL